MSTEGLDAFDEETRRYLLRATGRLRFPPGTPSNPNVLAAVDEILEIRRRKGWGHMAQGGRRAICEKWGVSCSAVGSEMYRRVARGRPTR